MRLPLGLTLPPLDTIGMVAGGLILQPWVSTQINGFIPATVTTSLGTAAPYVVDALSVLLPGFVLRRFVSPRIGNLYMAGAGARVLAKWVAPYLPAGFGGMAGYIGAQPLLGKYTTTNVRTIARGGQANRMISTAPERLNPANRF